jgi:hypothetical protein
LTNIAPQVLGNAYIILVESLKGNVEFGRIVLDEKLISKWI